MLLDKNRGIMSVAVPKFDEKLITKWNVLSYIAFIYYPLGLITSSNNIEKVIYYELCDK